MAADDETPYRVAARDGRYEVSTSSGRVVVVCRDEGSARQYAVMLQEAWRLGYKAGFREARRSADPEPAGSRGVSRRSSPARGSG